jgi:hypothetical protein
MSSEVDFSAIVAQVLKSKPERETGRVGIQAIDIDNFHFRVVSGGRRRDFNYLGLIACIIAPDSVTNK